MSENENNKLHVSATTTAASATNNNYNNKTAISTIQTLPPTTTVNVTASVCGTDVNMELGTVGVFATETTTMPKASHVSYASAMAPTTSAQFLQKMSPQIATVMSSSKMEAGGSKTNLRSPISSPLMSRKNRPNLPVSPKSTPPLPRKNHTNYPLAYNAMTGTISSPIPIPAVPARVMAAFSGTSPASSLSLSSSTSSPSSSPPPPPLPTRAPKYSSQSNLNKVFNVSAKESGKTTNLMTQSMNCGNRGNEPTTTADKLNRSLSKTCNSVDKEMSKIDLEKLIAQQKELEEKTAELSRNTKLNANLYDAEIERMNQYLKSLPDYSELDKKLHQEFQECEDLYDRLKRKHQQPLAKSNSHQSVMKTQQTQTKTTTAFTNNPVTKSSSINLGNNKFNLEKSQRFISNQQQKLRIGYSAVENLNKTTNVSDIGISSDTKLQRSMSSSNMPLNSNPQALQVVNRREQQVNIKPTLAQRNSLLLCSNLALNKQLMNNFWAENLATSQQRRTPNRSYWNYEKMCSQAAVGAAGAPLNVDAHTAKKLAIFDPTVAEAAQKELQKHPIKLQKNASLSQLDIKVRQAVTKEDLYKLICNESQPSAQRNTNSFVSKVPVKIINNLLPQVSETPLNKSVSLSNVPEKLNLARSTSRTHIPCYMRNLPTLSRSISNTALLLPAAKASYANTSSVLANQDAINGLLKSSSSSSVFATKYNPFGNVQPVEKERVVISTSMLAQKEKPLSPLSDELMMQAQLRERKKAPLDMKQSGDGIMQDSPSLDRKSEKSNSTISTNSVTVTNCCTTHLPDLSKLTSSFHLASGLASNDAKMQSHQLIKLNKNIGNMNVNNNNALGGFKIAKTQSLANMEVSKRQKDVENKYEKCLNDVSKTNKTPNTTAGILSDNITTTTTAATTPTATTNAANCARMVEQIQRSSNTNIPIYKQSNNFPINKSSSTSQLQQNYQRKNIYQQQDMILQKQQQHQEVQQMPYQQQKRTFINWNSFACAQQQQQQTSMVNNMHKKFYQLQQQHQLINQQYNGLIGKSIEGTTTSVIPSFLQKQPFSNTNKENKYNNSNNFPQQYVAATQQHHFLPLQKKQPNYVYQHQQQQQQPHQQMRNVPVTHSASFTTAQRPLATHLQYDANNNNNSNKQYFNQLVQINAMQQQQQQQQQQTPLENNLLQTFEPYMYTKSENMSVGANIQQKLCNEQQQQNNSISSAYQHGNRIMFPHQLKQSASTSTVNVAARQVLQQQKQQQQQQHFVYNTQQQQQQQYPSNTTNTVNFSCQNSNQMSKSAIAVHFSEVEKSRYLFVVHCSC